SSSSLLPRNGTRRDGRDPRLGCSPGSGMTAAALEDPLLQRVSFSLEGWLPGIDELRDDPSRHSPDEIRLPAAFRAAPKARAKSPATRRGAQTSNPPCAHTCASSIFWNSRRRLVQGIPSERAIHPSMELSSPCR